MLIFVWKLRGLFQTYDICNILWHIFTHILYFVYLFALSHICPHLPTKIWASFGAPDQLTLPFLRSNFGLATTHRRNDPFGNRTTVVPAWSSLCKWANEQSMVVGRGPHDLKGCDWKSYIYIWPIKFHQSMSHTLTHRTAMRRPTTNIRSHIFRFGSSCRQDHVESCCPGLSCHQLRKGRGKEDWWTGDWHRSWYHLFLRWHLQVAQQNKLMVMKSGGTMWHYDWRYLEVGDNAM